MAVLMMTMVMRAVTAMMTNNNGHDNGLTGDSERLAD